MMCINREMTAVSYQVNSLKMLWKEISLETSCFNAFLQLDLQEQLSLIWFDWC